MLRMKVDLLNPPNWRIGHDSNPIPGSEPACWQASTNRLGSTSREPFVSIKEMSRHHKDVEPARSIFVRADSESEAAISTAARFDHILAASQLFTCQRSVEPAGNSMRASNHTCYGWLVSTQIEAVPPDGVLPVPTRRCSRFTDVIIKTTNSSGVKWLPACSDMPRIANSLE